MTSVEAVFVYVKFTTNSWYYSVAVNECKEILINVFRLFCFVFFLHLCILRSIIFMQVGFYLNSLLVSISQFWNIFLFISVWSNNLALCPIVSLADSILIDWKSSFLMHKRRHFMNFTRLLRLSKFQRYFNFNWKNLQLHRCNILF